MLNHRTFIEKANQLLNLYEGTGSILLYYLDFANFKLVNYFYGIEKGSELLQAVMDYMTHLPQVAYAERVFSDQFVFLVFTREERTDEEVLTSYNRHVQTFLAKQQDKYPACNLKFYCGITRLKDHNIMEAIDLANMARMDARKTNASTAVLYTEAKLHQLATQKKKEKDIVLALHERRFTFFLQPKVDILTGNIVGAEALARRLNKDGSLVFPDSFVSIMEENGTIVELDVLVLDQTCRYIQDRLRQGLPAICTSVNLSRLHVQNKETAERLHSVVQQYDIPPKYLEFELTESILLNEFDAAKELVDKLRAYGYSVSIDDFGSGYTGVNIFQQFNFDVLKLDRRFLSDDEMMKERNTALIPSLVSIANKIGVHVICEGVERAEQCRWLLGLGCHYVQGFYFSQAVPPDEFYQMYQEHNGKYDLAFQENNKKIHSLI